MTAQPVLLVLLALLQAAPGPTRLPWAPPGLRLLALETGPEGPRAWVEERESGELRAVTTGDRLDAAVVIALDPAWAGVDLRLPHPDVTPTGPYMRLRDPNVTVRWHAFGTVEPALFGAGAGECPRYLDRVEPGAAVLIGDEGERRLAIGERICGDWRVAELPGPGPGTPEGLLVLADGERRLFLRPAWP